MNEKITNIQVLGSILKEPSILSKIDKYNLTPNDFQNKLERIVFIAAFNLHENGVQVMNSMVIDNYLKDDPVAKKVFNDLNGIEYVDSIIDLAEVDNFDYYYNRLKKINLINALKKMGYPTNNFWCDNPLDENAYEINKRFDSLTIPDILKEIRKKITKIEKDFLQNETTEARSAAVGIRELITELKETVNVGLPLQGAIFNEIIGGAEKGTLCIRSAPTSVGKSRNMVADVCGLAYPFRFDWATHKWERYGSCEKVLYIMTEQDYKEIQKMILSYLTGINGDRFRYTDFTPEEEKVISQACDIMEEYAENVIYVKLPDPSIELVKSVVRENYLVHNIEYVFYDYIFLSSGLISEFKGSGLRNDELFLLFTTALKDLASELNIFVMSATQVNAKADDNSGIRNEATLAGGRATINKADNGAIMARVTPEELELIRKEVGDSYLVPNFVTDIFKVRGGRWTYVKIWSYIDLGTLRKQDLCVTDQKMNPITDFRIRQFSFQTWDDEYEKYLQKRLESLNE